MAGSQDGSQTVECPKGKKYLRGVNAGDIIKITLYENGRGICPEARKCKELCEFKKK